MFQHGSTEIVKRWVNEAQEAVTSDHIMVQVSTHVSRDRHMMLAQYHAIGLLYHIRKHDRLAVSKLVTKLSRSGLRSPYAYCILIRIACKVLEAEERSSNNSLYDFLETCLRHRSDVG